MALFANFVAFQLGWFAAVLSAAAGEPWIGTLVMAAVLALHLALATRPARELGLLLACGVIGGTWDSGLVAAGWVGYESGMLLPYAAPYWIVAMWMSFATTLNRSLAWLKGHDLLAAGFGAIGAPLAYLAGQRLGGIELRDPLAACTALALGWALLMPLLLRLASRVERARSPTAHGWIAE